MASFWTRRPIFRSKSESVGRTKDSNPNPAAAGRITPPILANPSLKSTSPCRFGAEAGELYYSHDSISLTYIYFSTIMDKCVACLDPITGVRVRAPCGHEFDIPCVRDLFQTAVHDESTFPPRCCYMSIPLVSVQPYLTPDLIDRYVERDKESGTVNRVYCARQNCSRFLGARVKNTTLACPASGCLTRTCGWCKVELPLTSPPRHKCTNNGDIDNQVLKLSQQEGWTRCPGCGQMIELNKGCYHITCRCKTQFCYLCAALWKTCACRRGDDQELIRAAEARVRHLHGATSVRNRMLVREAIEQLCLVHDCGGVFWKSSWGRLRACQMCYRRQLWDISVSRC